MPMFNFFNDGERGVNHYCETPLLMIQDFCARQLNHILRVNEELMASNERMQVVIATLQSEVQTNVVSDLMVVAEKLSEVEYQAYVRNRKSGQ